MNAENFFKSLPFSYTNFSCQGLDVSMAYFVSAHGDVLRIGSDPEKDQPLAVWRNANGLIGDI